MLQRSSFKRPAYARAAPSVPTRGRGGSYSTAADKVLTIAKESPARSEPYRRLVAAMACIHCGIAGLSQCAHANTGKGAGIKADDRESFPLCCDSPGRQECHPKFDQGALFSKAVRRLIEPAWAADTRRRIQAAGMWPKGLEFLDPQGEPA